MGEPLHVDPPTLHKAGGDVLDAMDQSTAEHSMHHEELESAVPGMPLESASALQGLVAAWTEQREELHRAVGHHGMNMQAAASQYHQADQDAGDSLNQKAMDLGL